MIRKNKVVPLILAVAVLAVLAVPASADSERNSLTGSWDRQFTVGNLTRPLLVTYHQDGLIVVVKAGPKYEEIAVNDMLEQVMATPAISDGALLVRTRGHLYALGAAN